MSLLITKAKPNPYGKDRVGRTLTPEAQLAGEWIDFKNISSAPVNLGNIRLYHKAYLNGGDWEWELVTDFTGVLPVGEIIRVHSGGFLPTSQMNPVDQAGVDHYVFSGKNYVWNNSKTDSPYLWNQSEKKSVDITEYDAYPTEGRILNRMGDKLI